MVQGMDDIPGGIKESRLKCRWPKCSATPPLRSLTQGRATYSMEFKHYNEAPEERR
jgi:hypothetical protein